MYSTPDPDAARTCRDCGADISDRHGNARYCPPCSDKRGASAGHEYYLSNPARREYHRIYYKRRNADPEYRAQRQAQMRAYFKRRRANPEHRELDRAKTQEYYKRRMADPELKARHLAKATRWRERVKADPVAYAQYLERERLRSRRRYLARKGK